MEIEVAGPRPTPQDPAEADVVALSQALKEVAVIFPERSAPLTGLDSH